ncbi:MAG: 5'-nucleotidase C-terminal domain-containing protein [Bacteroidales bacterium]|nr:5'-nucleotidase C-terminal domain-containing protein [Bacteroidales bacterium]
MKLRVVLALCLLAPYLSVSAQEDRRLIILHTNDFHSHFQGFAPESAYTPLAVDGDPTVGGFARIAGLISAVRSANPGSSLVLDAGDCHMGTLFQALEPSTGFQLNLMAKAGYDVVALGNHDFDFGPVKFVNMIDNALNRGGIPVLLSGNSVTDPQDPADDVFEAALSKGDIRRYFVTEKAGIRIGIFSLLGEDADESAPYAYPITFAKNVRTAKKLVKELKKEGCEMIICLSHSGIGKDKNGEWAGEDVHLAHKVKGIDLIISGHTHSLLDKPLMANGVPIVSAGDNGRYVGKIELVADGNGTRLDKYTLIKIDDSIMADDQIQAAIETQLEKVNEEILTPLGLHYKQPVAIAEFPLTVEEHGDMAGSNLGALVADALYYYVNNEGPGTDIAIVALGVIRDPILPGTQGVADLFRTMSLGSGNDRTPGYGLSKLWVTGKEMKNIAEILIFLSKSTPSNFCYYSHLRIEYDPDGRIFNKVRKIELTDKDGNVSELDTSKENPKLYSIVANSYMVDNLGLIKKKTFGLIKVEPKDADGNLVTDFSGVVADFNKDVPGIQEGKEWLALLSYLRQFDSREGEAVPVIPEYYRNPDRSLISVTGSK